MATSEKKVILFLVEGTSDKVSLQAIFENYYNPLNLQVDVIHSDITQDSIASDIKTRLNAIVNNFCVREKLKIRDLNRIIHIVDTDGVFISEENIFQNEDLQDETYYTLNEIHAKDRLSMINRNRNKAKVLKNISKITELTVTSVSTNFRIPYSVYYFSRNLEHVLHNIEKKLTDGEKKDLSNKFDDKYEGDFVRFKTFISDKLYAVSGNYKETWNFIQNGNNSLNRFTNLHLIFSAN